MPYIAIEGCIASGKTTLAKAVASKLGISVTLENYHDVTSLELFYEDQDKYAFETEIQFTQAHYNRLATAVESHGESVFVTDFTLQRDLLFATITLESQPGRLEDYQRFWQDLSMQLPEPAQSGARGGPRALGLSRREQLEQPVLPHDQRSGQPARDGQGREGRRRGGLPPYRLGRQRPL